MKLTHLDLRETITDGKLKQESDFSVAMLCFQGASRISFCIGGAYGHGTQVKKRANVTIRLSSMVLNHQIALVVLMEQLYR